MEPRILVNEERKLIGLRHQMCFANYRVSDLWRTFMPMRDQIPGRINSNLISMAIYPPGFYLDFNPNIFFDKWAATEVISFDIVPDPFEKFLLPEGVYAVFDYKGLNTDNAIYRYIFQTWLPASGYRLDERPHFEWLGEKYRNDDPESEEEIWIPVRRIARRSP